MNKLAVIPKNKKGGIVSGTVWAVGGLIIGVILILVVVSTIGNAGLVPNDLVSTYTIVNESVTFSTTNVAQTLTAGSYAYGSCGTITYLANGTTTGASLNLGNVTQTGCSVINASALSGAGTGNNGTIYISYPWTETLTHSNDAVTSMRGNFTSGIDNVSSKIPTILLIVAVVFLFGALVLLVRQAQGMGVFGGSSGGSL